MNIESIFKIISYFGYISFIVFTVLSVVIFVKKDIRNVFGFLSGHVAAKRIAEMKYSSGGVGGYSQSRVKSNSLFKKNNWKNESTNRLKTDRLLKNSSNQVTEKLSKTKSLNSFLKKDNQITEPLVQKSHVTNQKTELLGQKKEESHINDSEMSQCDETDLLDDYPQKTDTEVFYQNYEKESSNDNNISFHTEVLIEKTHNEISRGQSYDNEMQGHHRIKGNYFTEVLSDSFESKELSADGFSELCRTEESFTEVLGIDADALSHFSDNDIEEEKRMHKEIHVEVVPGFILEKEIVLTHTADRIPRS